MLRRHLGMLALSLFSGPFAWSQPATPVRLVVPFATGGPTDVAARVMAPLLSESLGRPVIVDNRVGATGAIGAEYVAKSPADGSTILFGTSSIMAANVALMPKLPFDPIQDFVALSQIAAIENILVVHPSVPANNVQELIRYARDNPGKLNYGSSGVGSTYHLGAEFFANLAKVQMTHVPYKGQGPAVQDLLAGHLQVMFDAYNSAVPNMKAGRVRALGLTSAKRNPDLPDLPTVAEQGLPGYVTAQWLAFFLPAKTPAATVDKLNQTVVSILQRPDVRDRFLRLGLLPVSSTPSELDTLLKRDIALWSKVVKEGNIKPE
jgi:tripartite-type tricarboxylate transporter receptor subunit TctC